MMKASCRHPQCPPGSHPVVGCEVDTLPSTAGLVPLQRGCCAELVALQRLESQSGKTPALSSTWSTGLWGQPRCGGSHALWEPPRQGQTSAPVVVELVQGRQTLPSCINSQGPGRERWRPCIAALVCPESPRAGARSGMPYCTSLLLDPLHPWGSVPLHLEPHSKAQTPAGRAALGLERRQQPPAHGQPLV